MRINDDKEVMNILVALYDKAKDETGWAEFRNMISLSDTGKVTVYHRMNRVHHLWERKKQGTVVLVKPIHNWDEHIQTDEEKTYFAQDEFMLIADMIGALNSIESNIKRLKKMKEVLSLTNGESKYEGAYSDYQKKVSLSNSLLKELIE